MPIVIGVVAVIGWALDLPALTRFLSTRSAMQPVTALCAILVGAGLVSVSIRHARPVVSRILAVAIIALAVQTLLQFALGIDFGTDHLLFADAVNAQPSGYRHPGRMAAPTAIGFLLVGTGLLAAGIRSNLAALVASAAATTVLLLVTIALLSHLYLVAPLGGVLGFTQVSLPTALALGGASVGVLALKPAGGWVHLLVGRSIGATAARWLLPIMVVVPVVVATLALKGSAADLYPRDFQLAFTTAITVALLAALALWGTAQLDTLVSVRRDAEVLQESEATLRAFFETDGLFASILERRGDDIRYLAANHALADLLGRGSLVGVSVHDVDMERADGALIDKLRQVEASGAPAQLERCFETAAGTRWFATTISPIAGSAPDAPRFATASLEITDRKRAEAQQRLLLDELNHRVKNTLAVVQSLAQQSFRGDMATSAAKQAFEARLMAVAAAHKLLVQQDWVAVSVSALVADVVGPGCGADRGRIDISGPDMELPPQTAVSIALALHELCTNAVKYGALSNDRGRVSIRWKQEPPGGGRLRFTWVESDGPPVTAPTTRGFGSRLIERALAAELGSPVAMDFRPEGLICMIEAILPDTNGGPTI
ncbi:HWE histidine kinase domain-containing protein [Croceibacterium sp. TMG7-5b_MA50]|uniref:sensor histidine kinase n=1 Tax=Croceibacterium sp. TMG7-5b_MA50 TaxID=3121290 RepID=UPI003221E240